MTDLLQLITSRYYRMVVGSTIIITITRSFAIAITKVSGAAVVAVIMGSY